MGPGAQFQALISAAAFELAAFLTLVDMKMPAPLHTAQSVTPWRYTMITNALVGPVTTSAMATGRPAL